MSDYMARMRKQLIRDEGIETRPYTDTVGKLTIGVGRNLTDRGISEEEALHLLDNDIALCHGELLALPWFEKLDEVRQAAMVNLCFNMGMTKLMTFRRTLEAMRVGDYESASYALLQSKYATQVGNRAKRVSEQIRTGVWQ
jgi:lysozyme